MDVFDYNQKNVPEYRNNLYQDGYSPEQILQSFRQKQRENLRADDNYADIRITSEVKIK